MIQDIFPEKLDNHYVHQAPDADGRILVFREGKLLVRHDGDTGDLIYPMRKEFPPDFSAVYLFSVGGMKFFLGMDPEAVPEGYAWYSMPELRMLKRSSNVPVLAAYTGWHLWKWYGTSRYCGACGAKTAFDTAERAMTCPVCGNKIYPRINPAVIVGVTNGEKIVLTRYKVGYGHNSLVAGFTEIGETAEETVSREVMEEIGLKVKNIRYYKSQPWGIASDILMGFYCDVDGDPVIRRDDSELKYAEWVERKDIELQPTDDSLTNEMMKVFRDEGYRGTIRNGNRNQE